MKTDNVLRFAKTVASKKNLKELNMSQKKKWLMLFFFIIDISLGVQIWFDDMETSELKLVNIRISNTNC